MIMQGLGSFHFVTQASNYSHVLPMHSAFAKLSQLVCFIDFVQLCWPYEVTAETVGSIEDTKQEVCMHEIDLKLSRLVWAYSFNASWTHTHSAMVALANSHPSPLPTHFSSNLPFILC